MQQQVLNVNVVNKGYFDIAVTSILGMKAKGNGKTAIDLKNGTKHRAHGRDVVNGTRRVLVHGDVAELRRKWQALRKLQANNGEGEVPREAKVVKQEPKSTRNKGGGWHDARQYAQGRANAPGLRTPYGSMSKLSEQAYIRKYGRKAYDDAVRIRDREQSEAAAEPTVNGSRLDGMGNVLGRWLKHEPKREVKVADVDSRTEQRTPSPSFDEVRCVRQPEDFAMPKVEAFDPDAVAKVMPEGAPSAEATPEDQWLEALMNEDWRQAEAVVASVLRETGTWGKKRAQLKDARGKRDTLVAMVAEYTQQLGRATEAVERLEDDMKDMSDADVAAWEKRSRIVAAALA